MHNIAKKVIEVYLNEKKIPTLEELWLLSHEFNNTKYISFVTIYKEGKIIASSWRINVKKSNTLLELIENSLYCIKDPRFIESIKNAVEINKVKFRVDIIMPNQRKIVNKIEEIDISKHWLIIINQEAWKLGIILPNIANMISSPKDLFELVCKKAWIDSNATKEDEYILYSIESTQYWEF